MIPQCTMSGALLCILSGRLCAEIISFLIVEKFGQRFSEIPSEMTKNVAYLALLC